MSTKLAKESELVKGIYELSHQSSAIQRSPLPRLGTDLFKEVQKGDIDNNRHSCRYRSCQARSGL